MVTPGYTKSVLQTVRCRVIKCFQIFTWQREVWHKLKRCWSSEACRCWGSSARPFSSKSKSYHAWSCSSSPEQLRSVLNGNHYHPYHFQRVQALNPKDYERWVQFAEWYLNKELQNPNFSELVLFSNEAAFTRSGLFNLNNNYKWQLNNPHIVREHAYQQRYSINVWAGILHNSIIGPCIMPSPLNGNNYRVF